MGILTIFLEKAIGIIFNISEEEIKDTIKNKKYKRAVFIFLFLILIIVLISVFSFNIIKEKTEENKKLTSAMISMNNQLIRINLKLNQELDGKSIQIEQLNSEKSELVNEKNEIENNATTEIERVKNDARLSDFQKDKLIEQIVAKRDENLADLLKKIENIEKEKSDLQKQVEDIKNERDSLIVINKKKDEIIASVETKPVICSFTVEKRLDGINKSDGSPDKGISTQETNIAKKIIELSISIELSRPRENNDYFTMNIINNGLNISKEVSSISVGENKGILILNFRKRSLKKGTLKVEFCNMGKVISTKAYTLK